MRGHIAKKGNRYYVVIYEGPDHWLRQGTPSVACGRRYPEGCPAVARRSGKEEPRWRLPRPLSASPSASTSKTSGFRPRRLKLRASTFDSYRRNIELHVVPAIGAVPLQKLTPEHLDTFYAELLTSGRRNGKGGGLSVKSVRNIHTMLHKALADAARKGTVLRNVAAVADPPRRAGGRARR